MYPTGGHEYLRSANYMKLTIQALIKSRGYCKQLVGKTIFVVDHISILLCHVASQHWELKQN